jgi:hypothetical protein
LNYVHAGIFNKKAVADSALELIGISGSHFASSDPLELLLYYRSLEKDVSGRD